MSCLYNFGRGTRFGGVVTKCDCIYNCDVPAFIANSRFCFALIDDQYSLISISGYYYLFGIDSISIFNYFLFLLAVICITRLFDPV